MSKLTRQIELRGQLLERGTHIDDQALISLVNYEQEILAFVARLAEKWARDRYEGGRVVISEMDVEHSTSQVISVIQHLIHQ